MGIWTYYNMRDMLVLSIPLVLLLQFLPFYLCYPLLVQAFLGIYYTPQGASFFLFYVENDVPLLLPLNK